MESLEYLYSNENIKYNSFDLNEKKVGYLFVDEPYSKHDYDSSKLKITVKLFLYPEIFHLSDKDKEEIIDEAIESIRKILDIDHITTLILSIQTNNIDEVVMNLKPFWSICENFVHRKAICFLGTSDLNLEQLMDFYNVVNIKPFSSQINLDACCDIPANLAEFAREKSIQLLTHNDSIGKLLNLDFDFKILLKLIFVF